MNLHGKNFLGAELSGSGSDVYHAWSPATGERLEPGFHEAVEREIDRALELAEEAFADYRARPPEERAAFLDRIADEISSLGEPLSARVAAETGYPEARVAGEKARTVHQLRMFADLVREGSWVEARIDSAMPERKPLAKPDLRRMLIPLGPIAVFGASNFPLAFSVAGCDTAAALAAGNPAVVKAHPSHPGTSEIIAEAIREAVEKCAMPRGLFSMLHGRKNDVGLHLVRHPLTRAVAFTGSLKGGRALFDAAAARPEPIPVYAEMGSVNPLFLLPAALRERAGEIAEGLKQSLTLGAGQFCTNPGLVVAMTGDELVLFIAKLRTLVCEHPPATMLSEPIRQSYEKGCGRFQETAGVRVAARSASAPDPARTEAAAVVFETDARTFLERPELSEEVFGPSTLVVRCSSPEDIDKVARSLRGQLTASIHCGAGDLDRFRSLVPILEMRAGRLIFNGFPTGVEVCPSMHHGGPYPATTDSRSTSVGTAAILRFARPICYQGFPQDALPTELRHENERGIWRLVDGRLTQGEG